jgi:mRNA-degrading endonuclease RelE of RelBE toxin-antitoxin system
MRKAKIDRLTNNPRPPGAELLKGTTEKLWRVGVGDYRIVFPVENKRLGLVVTPGGQPL